MGNWSQLCLQSAATAGAKNRCWGEANKSDQTRRSKSLLQLQPPSLCLVPQIGRKNLESHLAKKKRGLPSPSPANTTWNIEGRCEAKRR